LFFPPKRVRVRFFKIGLGLGLVFVLALGLRFEFGFGKLIGGAVGAVGWGSRKPPVLLHPTRRQLHVPLSYTDCLASDVTGRTCQRQADVMAMSHHTRRDSQQRVPVISVQALYICGFVFTHSLLPTVQASTASALFTLVNVDIVCVFVHTPRFNTAISRLAQRT